MSFLGQGMWGSKYGKNTRKYERKKSARGEFIELVVFVCFLLVTTIVALSTRHIYMYYFNKTIDDLFLAYDLEFESKEALRFHQIVTVGDWWRFLQFTVLPDLHHDAEEGDDERKLLYENLLLGPPRLRQIRVHDKSCHVHQAFSRYFDRCYDAYSSSTEEKSEVFKGTKFHSLDDLYATSLWGKLSRYQGGGYVRDLSFNHTENVQILTELKTKKWIDRGTRVVMFEMSLFNANTDLFSSAKFIAEFPPTGGIVPSSHLQALKRFSIWTEGDYFVLASAVLFYILTVYYTIEESIEMPKIGFINYIGSKWNMVDLVIITIAYISFAYNIWHPTYLARVMERFSKDPDHFQSLDIICSWNILYIDMMGICTFLVWIKVFKYVSFNKTMLQFSNTFKKCGKDLFGFTVMFTIVFLAYAELGLILFGTVHPDFRTLKESFLTMMRMVLGDFDYEALEEANRVMAPIFFITFTIIVFFILLNMFIAIITDTYTEVKSELQHGSNRLEEFIKTMFLNFFNLLRNCSKRPNIKGNQDKITHGDNLKFEDSKQKIIDVSPEARSETSVYPRSPATITPIRVKKSAIYREYFEEIDQDSENITRLTKRVERMENILEQLIVNLDGILLKIESKKRPKP